MSIKVDYIGQDELQRIADVLTTHNMLVKSLQDSLHQNRLISDQQLRELKLIADILHLAKESLFSLTFEIERGIMVVKTKKRAEQIDVRDRTRY